MIIEKEKGCMGVAFNIAKYKGRYRTTFKEGNRIYNVFVDRDFEYPCFYEAELKDYREVGNLIIKSYEFSGYLDRIPLLGRVYGVVIKKFNEEIKVKRDMIVKQDNTYMVLTTDDKLYCFCCSFVDDVNLNDIVKIDVIRKREDNKKLLYGVITKRYGFDEGLERISETYSIEEFFRNIEDKRK